MTGLADILDAVAVKARAVTGIVGASGTGITTGVDGAPAELPGTPYAVCYLGSGSAVQGSLTTYEDEVEIRIYVPASGIPGAYATLVGFPDLFEVAWRTDRDLGGLVDDSWYTGHGRVEREDWGTVAYLTMPIRIGLYRDAAADLAP
jgi:hypothetical protein